MGTVRVLLPFPRTVASAPSRSTQLTEAGCPPCAAKWRQSSEVSSDRRRPLL